MEGTVQGTKIQHAAVSAAFIAIHDVRHHGYALVQAHDWTGGLVVVDSREQSALNKLITVSVTQGDGSSYGVLTTTMKGSIEENSPSSNSNSSLGHLFTYGTLTLAQVGPGFVAFCGMRFCAWMVLGSSQQRKFQFSRRTEVSSIYVNALPS